MMSEGGVLYGADEIVARFVNDLCGGGFETGSMQAALGVLGPHGLIGGVIFSNHQPGKDITVTVATTDPKGAHPRVVARCLAYPYVKLNLPRITAEIEASNERSLRNAKKLGFTEEGKKRGTEVVILGMLKDEFAFRHLMAGIYHASPEAPTADAA